MSRIDQCSPIEVREDEGEDDDGLRLSHSTLDAIRKDVEESILGVLEWSGYFSLSGLDITHMHDEEYGLGSVFVLLRTERVGWDATAAQQGGQGRVGPKGVKVWICLADAENCWEEYEECKKRGEFP